MDSTPRHDPVGSTPEDGWQLGVRRTLPATAEEVWQRLLTEWLPRWMEVDSVPQMVGAPLRHRDQIRGRVVGCHVGRRVRLRWQPAALGHETVFQVTLEDGSDGTAVSIHQEGLMGPAERQSQLEHWTGILDGLVTSYRRETDPGQDLPG